MRFFWPNRLNPNPSAITRLGRVLHWIGTTVAALAILLGFSFASAQPTQAAGYLAVFGGFGVLIYLAGRALRYIFSGE